jgi:hypothetical protein
VKRKCTREVTPLAHLPMPPGTRERRTQPPCRVKSMQPRE